MRGMQSEINLATLFMKRLTLTGSTLRRLEAPERARCFDAIRDRIWPSVLSGVIRPIVDKAYPLSDVLSAHEHMRSGTHFGKLVLDCRVVETPHPARDSSRQSLWTDLYMRLTVC